MFIKCFLYFNNVRKTELPAKLEPASAAFRDNMMAIALGELRYEPKPGKLETQVQIPSETDFSNIYAYINITKHYTHYETYYVYL